MKSADERLPVLRTVLKTYFIDFLSNASVGGLANIARAKNIFLRLFWIVYVACSVAFCSYSIYNYALEYLDYDVVSKTDIIFENQPHFPKLKICKDPFIQIQNPQCFFNTQPCPGKQLTNAGLCLEFNTGRNQSGYLKDSSEILTSKEEGLRNAFILAFNGSVPNQEIKLFINNQSLIVDNNKPIVMSNGQYHIVLSRTFVQRLPKPYSDCKAEFTYDSETTGSFPYFQSECYRQCFIRAQQTACGHAANFTVFEHLIHVNEQLFDQEHNQLLGQCGNKTALTEIQAEFFRIGESRMCASECPIECNSVLYTIQSRYSVLGYNGFKLYVYFEDFEYTIIQQVPKITPFNLFGNVGGVFGLLLGASVMSFVEIFELGFMLVHGSFEHYLAKSVRPVKPKEQQQMTAIIISEKSFMVQR